MTAITVELFLIVGRISGCLVKAEINGAKDDQ